MYLRRYANMRRVLSDSIPNSSLSSSAKQAPIEPSQIGEEEESVIGKYPLAAAGSIEWPTAGDESDTITMRKMEEMKIREKDLTFAICVEERF